MLGLDLLKEVPGLLEEIKALSLRLDEERFRFWLQQDYPFVEALYRYQVGLLLEAPQAHRAPLVQALMATVEELDWLLLQGASPSAPVHPVRAGYIALLEEMGRLPYAYRVVFFYFLNGLFLEAWAHHVQNGATEPPTDVVLRDRLLRRNNATRPSHHPVADGAG